VRKAAAEILEKIEVIVRRDGPSRIVGCTASRAAHNPETIGRLSRTADDDPRKSETMGARQPTTAR
jgi:hypothetical protein